MQLPAYLTHYYIERPFQRITALEPDERTCVLAELAARRDLPRRLRSDFYFEQRLRYELLMHEQFLAKGGHPRFQRPHYAVLGESEIQQKLASQSLRIPLDSFPSECISFTYSDSWVVYVDQDLSGHPIRRKPHYGMIYRLEELPDLFSRCGWPGDRWKTDERWKHDVYVEAQIWNDEPLREYLASHN